MLKEGCRSVISERGRRVCIKRGRQHQEGGIGRITTSGSITTFPTPDSPCSIATGPDGALWFTVFGHYSTGGDSFVNGYIGRMTTSGLSLDPPSGTV